MTADKKNIYKFANIRKLLINGFLPLELKRLCFDECGFKQVYSQINWDHLHDIIVDELLEYTERKMLVKELLEWAKKENPARYHFHQPYDLTELEDILKSEYLTREMLGEFFNLKGDNRTITVYLSRHFAEIRLPILKGDPAPDYTTDQSEDGFDVVSAVEMLEAIWLKDAIERPIHWLPDEMQKELSKVKITVKLEVCPELKDIDKTLGKGTRIFIGGSRANLGTLYYLFALKAGIVRPTRWLQNIDGGKQPTKDIIECVSEPHNKSHRCKEENLNLGIIQRHKMTDYGQTIIYLAGTGINGTGGAVAYFRKRWLDLLLELREKEKENIYKVIEVPRRDPKEKLTNYGPNYWTDPEEKWKEVDEFSCD